MGSAGTDGICIIKGRSVYSSISKAFIWTCSSCQWNLDRDWKNGYTSFEYEITQALQPGQNEILLRVVHQAPNSRWYSGAGIYRSVWLKTRGDNYLATDGILCLQQAFERLR